MSKISRLQLALVIALVAWGALAFGAVYPWGYRALAGASVLAGAIGLYAGSNWRRVPAGIVIAFALVVVSVLLQQVPLPRPLLERLSPATVTVLEQREFAFSAASSSAWHALSIDTVRTWTGLFLLVIFGTLWLGLTASLTERMILRIADGIVVCGLAITGLAIAGFSEHYSGKVLGFWKPLTHAAPFGPFINRNHYAGWMLMTVPFGAGYLMALITRERAGARRSWRARLAWLSTPQANRMLMLAVALTVMTMSVFLSLSRSGIVCLAIFVIAFGLIALRRIARRRLTVACIAIVAMACVGWAGIDRIGTRFAEFQSDRSGGRLGIWRDTINVARAFPVAGTGLDTFGVAMLFYQTTDLLQHYEEAHNDYLQIAAEGGLLVGVPAFALALVTAYQVQRRFRERLDTPTTFWLRAGAVAGLLTIALQELVDFSLQMPGNAALFCVLAAIAVHSPRQSASRARPSTVPAERRTSLSS
jgi:O-antigen ligase